MKDPVHGRGQDQPDIGNKNHPAEQGIKRGEDLSALRFHRIHQSHPAQDHGGIVEGIQPVHPRRKMIPQGTDQ